MNAKMQKNFDLLFSEVIKLKEENLDIKKQSLAIQNDLKPFLKSILEMQLYSFNNLNSYKGLIIKIDDQFNNFKKRFVTEIAQINKNMNSNLKEKENLKENVFSGVLKDKTENTIGKASRFLEKSSKISLKKNIFKDSQKIIKKEIDCFDP